MEDTQPDYGNWKYEDSLDGYGPATQHVWVNDTVDGVLKIAQSEGMHIMKCERGEWLVTVNTGPGGEDEYWCFETEQDALENIQDLIPTHNQ